MSNDKIKTMPLKDINTNNTFLESKHSVNKYSGKEITTKCWNCDQTMLIQPDWKIIQCVGCLKLNRIPGSGMFDDEVIPGQLKYKDETKQIELEISVPIQSTIVMCPFCNKDNRISLISKKVLCYSCKNVFSVKQDRDIYNNKLVDHSKSINDDFIKKNTGSPYSINNNIYSNNKDPYGLASDNTFKLHNNCMENSYRISDLYPDIMHYPGLYPSFNPYSFYPWFMYYWDIYEKEFEDLVERREKYELFKELLRKEEHEYLHVNKPKEKYKAINHLMANHKRITEGINDIKDRYYKSKHSNYSNNLKNDYNNNNNNGNLRSLSLADNSNKTNFKYSTLNNLSNSHILNNHSYSIKNFNTSNINVENNFNNNKKLSLFDSTCASNIHNNRYSNNTYNNTPNLDKYINYEQTKYNSNYSRKYPDYSVSMYKGYNC